jgi:hypothetical protein
VHKLQLTDIIVKIFVRISPEFGAVIKKDQRGGVADDVQVQTASEIR